MAIYTIGDVHGHLEVLDRLLDRLPFDAANDELWLTGDLVNRGPDSTGVLRRARELGERLGDRFQVVLGNHDLHAIARWMGLAKAKKKDTLDDLLAVPDRDELFEWLRHRPLFVRRERTVLVHAGLHPDWSFDAAERRARKLEANLRAPASGTLLASWRDPSVSGPAADLRSFTLLRTCRDDGSSCDFAGPPAEAPDGCEPWFDRPHHRPTHATVIFGHWAALGLLLRPGLVGLDTGCAWGGHLTAVRLDDGLVVQEPAGAQQDG